ncbi:unnamed protein product [Withania somnifera]
MVGGPLGWKCKTNGSICSEVVEKQLEGPIPNPLSSVWRSVDALMLKENSSHALSTKVLCGKETESTRELRSAEMRNRSSFSSPTISSSRKTSTEKQKVQVQQIKPRFKKDLLSEATKTSQLKDTPVPSRPPLPVPKKTKKISSPPQVLKQITPIQTSINPSQPTATRTKSSQKSTRNQNSGSQCEPSKQYVRRPVTQKTSPKISTSSKEPSRIRERYVGDEEPINHIVWEENDLSEMPDEYADAYEDEYYDDVEPSIFPSVAILSYGHSFHALCLDDITPEEDSSDPPCFFVSVHVLRLNQFVEGILEAD